MKKLPIANYASFLRRMFRHFALVTSRQASRFRKRLFPGFRLRKIGARRVLMLESGNALVSKGIADGKPFLLSRFGTVELDYLIAVELAGSNTAISPKILEPLSNNAGVSPLTEKNLGNFISIYKNAAAQIDVLAVRDSPIDAWHRHAQMVGVELFAKRPPLVTWDVLFPYRAKYPWTNLLEGMRVLVIHPFAATIKQQIPKLSQIHGRDIFPDASFQLYRPPQLLADSLERSEWASWGDALVSVKQDLDKIEFDVALIAAGAMGLPIAAHIKNHGKVALHLGGDLQLLFGIKGSRWLRFYPQVAARMNDLWVFPAEAERPRGFRSVENGGYW